MPAAVSFFAHQQLARRNTRVMVVLFLLSVIAVVIAVDLVLATAYLWGASDLRYPVDARPSFWAMLGDVPRELYFVGAAVTGTVILVVSVVNVLRLAGGGAAVAEMVGARRVAPATQDPLERRLLNVVEEMAIAAGVRVPAVYVMDGERGINAFAAGYDVSNSIVAVTRGALETLTRDELQGVVAHEFSHILNGDMRLNIRMIGVLAGIVFIASIGEFLMRSMRGSRSSKNSGGVFAIGLALLVIGYVGLFFARLIKAAVSRQREFLADASSVQFTRNPEGIAGALDQIGRSTGLIANRYAEELAHLFFGQGIKVWFGGLFDTHPPIEERIRRVHPGFQPSAYQRRRAAAVPEPAAAGAEGPAPAAMAAFAGAARGTAGEGRRAGDFGTTWGRTAGESAALVGAMDRAKVDYAARLVASLPEALRQAVHETSGACAVIVATLLAPREDVSAGQLRALEAVGLALLGEAARRVAPQVRRLGPAYLLPLLDLALPAAKLASEPEKALVLQALHIVIHADQRVSMQEFVVLQLVRHQFSERKGPVPVTTRKVADLRAEVLQLLGVMAHAGVRADAAAERERHVLAAVRAGMQAMDLPGEVPAPGAFDAERAAQALDALKGLAPLQQAIVVKGLFAAVTLDRRIHVAEAELMRLVGAVLDCPLPPLFDSFDPATLVA